LEGKEIAILFGTIPVVLWVVKTIGEKLVDKFFKQAKDLEEIKDSMLNDKINRISSDMASLSNSLKIHGEEAIRQKIIMQGLTHEMSALRAELKTGQNYYKGALEKLATVLHSMNYQIKEQRNEIDKIGIVILKEK